MPITLTRGAIASEALSQIGRTDLTSNARLWLNLLLEKIYKVQDWSWLIKRNKAVSLVDGGSVPSDYWKFKTANLLLNGVVQRELVSATIDEFITIQRSGTTSGQPMRVYIDENLRTFNYWPTPDGQVYVIDLSYYYIPTLPQTATSANDADIPKWELAPEFLIRGIQLKGLYYNDDQRYKDEEAALMAELIAEKMNSFDRQGGKNKLKMGKSFRRRF